MCAAYCVFSGVQLPILGGSQCNLFNAKDVSSLYLDYGSSLSPGGAAEEARQIYLPRVYHDGVRLSEESVSPWVQISLATNVTQSTDVMAALAEDGQLYVGGRQLLWHLDPLYVCLPVAEVTGSFDEQIPASTKGYTEAPVFAGATLFRLCTTSADENNTWTSCAVYSYTQLKPFAGDGSLGDILADPLFRDACVYAISSDKHIYVAGKSLSGMLNAGTQTTALSTLTKISTATFSKLSVSSTHALAITEDNDLYAWGYVRSADTTEGVLNGKYMSWAGAGQAVSSCVFNAVRISGVVRELTITEPGSGYAVAPSISFAGACDESAVAIATLNTTNGGVASVRMLEGGLGYTTAPTITFSAPGGTHVRAEATCSIATKFKDCDAGNFISAVVDEDGYPFVAGKMINISIQRAGDGGLSTFQSQPAPVSVAKVSIQSGERGDFISNSGNAHFFMVGDSGDAFGMGINSDGRLGLGYTSFFQSTPLACCTGTSWNQVLASGGLFVNSSGIDEDGKIYVWGRMNGSTTSPNAFNIEFSEKPNPEPNELILSPRQVGPPDDRWKSISHKSARLLVIRDNENSPEADYA